MDPARVAFLAVVFATHSFVGYAVVRGVTDADPRIGLVFGLFPDADFLFPAALEWPFVHRGITHTPLFALVLAVGVAALWRRTVGVAVGLAYGSHLLLDSLSPKGIDWLFPIRTSWSPELAIHGVAATVLLWVGSVALLAIRTDALDSFIHRLRAAGNRSR